MEIIKNNDNYLIKNNYGSYHLSIKDFEELGEDEAIKFAEKEIRKKSRDYLDKNIDFKRARIMGLWGYGIKDFCEELNLDINGTYKLSDLKEKLTASVIIKYSDECFKLFGKDCLNRFGGPKGFLNSNRSRGALEFILNNYVSEKSCHELGVKFALRVIGNFEKMYPEDKRPRMAIEAKQRWFKNELSDNELCSALSAAQLASCSASHLASLSASHSAHSAALSAHSAAHLASLSASHSAHSAALSAHSASLSASHSAALSAHSAETEYQIDETLKELNDAR